MAEFPIVGIGSSAGGLEALQQLFRKMPPDGGLAFIVAAHLDPTQKSHLTELLGRCTKMPVVQIENSMKVEPDHVYVIAPDQELTIRESIVRTNKPTAPRGDRHPVDSFFRSLAEDQGERAIAIVLSGTGTNGSLGLRFIKAEGGIALAQDPETAAFAGMPRSAIGTGVIDLVLPPDKMPDALLSVARHLYMRQPAERTVERTPDEQLHALLTLVRSNTGRDFSSYRKQTLLRRVHRRMGLHRIEDLGGYIERLRKDPEEIAALAGDLTINVTGFFRDPDAWKALDQKVIAPLVQERPTGSTIRVWVPGCSTGEEAYSIAILFTERAEAAKKTFDLRLFATDVAQGVLSSARAGIYPASIAQDVTPERLERWFEMDEDAYTVRKTLGEAITFAPQNILQDPPFSRLDLVSCRNLLIYIEPDVQKRLLGLFHFALREGGHLFLGPAESITGHEDLFEPVSRKWRIYGRIGPTRHDIVDFPLVGKGDLILARIGIRRQCRRSRGCTLASW
jgi:two-component system, chemotaxis family, CheB/CheR fusion protein